MNIRFLLISGAIMGALAALLSVTPIASMVNCLACGWLWIAGAGAVWMYRANVDGPTGAREGIALGLVTGLFGAGFATLLSVLTGASAISADQLAQFEQRFGEEYGEMIRTFSSPGALLAISLLFNLVFYPFFGLVGGLIGLSIFKDKTPRGG